MSSVTTSTAAPQGTNQYSPHFFVGRARSFAAPPLLVVTTAVPDAAAALSASGAAASVTGFTCFSHPP